VTKLDERRKQYDIPELPYLPVGKVILVYRLPSEEVTKSGLVIPQVWTEKGEDGTTMSGQKSPDPKGVLVGAGLQALDVMRDHLISIGDIVYFGRFEGWEMEFKREQMKAGKYLIQMKIEGILGSVDAMERRKQFDVEYVETEDYTGHIYTKRTRKAA
jgi:co-chaperonin GroES (HSP10)